jgi:hypothetical protein
MTEQNPARRKYDLTGPYDEELTGLTAEEVLSYMLTNGPTSKNKIRAITYPTHPDTGRIDTTNTGWPFTITPKS